MTNPKISVIIPIYNVEKYVEKCIESVRTQSFTDIEIICVDDCSPDKSTIIVQKHMSEDERIVFIEHEKNTGLGGARNSAIRVAKGEYIASVDSDDYMRPNMLEKLWEASENGKFDIVSCGFNRVDEQGNILSSSQYSNLQIKQNEIDIFKTINPGFWNKLWRKSLFVDNQIFFPNHDYYEDMSTTPRILSKAKSVKIIRDRLYNYLIRAESITGSYGDKQIIDYFKGFEIIYDFLVDNELFEKYEEGFNDYVKNNVMYHTKNILSADLYIEEKKQYLRNLLSLRIGFQENYEYFRKKDIDDLILLCKKDSPSYISEKLTKANDLLDQKDNLIKKYDENAKNYQKNNLKLKDDILKLNSKSSQQVIDIKLLKENQIKLNEKINDYYKSVINLEKKLKNAENEIYETLSFRQQIYVSIFSVFAKFSLTKNQNLKLNKTPKLFFKDSKNKFVQRYSELFKIVD